FNRLGWNFLDQILQQLFFKQREYLRFRLGGGSEGTILSKFLRSGKSFCLLFTAAPRKSQNALGRLVRHSALSCRFPHSRSLRFHPFTGMFASSPIPLWKIACPKGQAIPPQQLCSQRTSSKGARDAGPTHPSLANLSGILSGP